MSLVRSVLSTVILIAVTQAAGAQFAPVPFTEPDEALLGAPVAAEPASYDRPSRDATTRLSAAGRCSRDRLGVLELTLSWQFSKPQPAEQRVDVSKLREGFSTGAFLTTGARPADERGVVFDTPEPGIHYYWRLLTRSADGWKVRGAGRVQAPVCPVDGVRE